MRRPADGLLALAVAVVVAGLVVFATSRSDDTGPTQSASTSASGAGRSVAIMSLPGVAIDAASGLPTIRPAALPQEARRTLERIATGGPFPFEQDGARFGNRERLLPLRSSGYYREYTVPTPGSADRGARRIVVGRAGEIYWTADHYASFAAVIP